MGRIDLADYSSLKIQYGTWFKEAAQIGDRKNSLSIDWTSEAFPFRNVGTRKPSGIYNGGSLKESKLESLSAAATVGASLIGGQKPSSFRNVRTQKPSSFRNIGSFSPSETAGLRSISISATAE